MQCVQCVLACELGSRRSRGACVWRAARSTAPPLRGDEQRTLPQGAASDVSYSLCVSPHAAQCLWRHAVRPWRAARARGTQARSVSVQVIVQVLRTPTTVQGRSSRSSEAPSAAPCGEHVESRPVADYSQGSGPPSAALIRPRV